MKQYRIRTDLERQTVNGYALPLGLEAGGLVPPQQGYTVAYTPGEEEDPDTYVFQIVISHERLRPLLARSFEFLPDEVCAIIEIGSRDAYRSMDVFLSSETIPLKSFLATWEDNEPILLEDVTIGAGANSDEPFVEVFLDQWKGIAIHVPLNMRDDVEEMLQQFGLEEVNQTWPEDASPDLARAQVRQVLDLTDETAPDLDEILLNLRHDWLLELNIDPESNVDEGGRHLGLTLWHALVIVEPVDEARRENGEGAYASIWATAGSMDQMEELIELAIEQDPKWSFSDIFTVDRVAYDERPDELVDLPPRRDEAEIHLVWIEPWGDPAGEVSNV